MAVDSQANQSQSEQRNKVNSSDRRPRGFAAMDENEQRKIAAKGGREAHRQGTAHEFDSAEAREAGRKGGESRAAARQAQHQDQRLRSQVNPSRDIEDSQDTQETQEPQESSVVPKNSRDSDAGL